MLVELGNTEPIGPDGTRVELDAPTVTYVNIPDHYTFDASVPLTDFVLHLVRNPDITHVPENEALLVVTHPLGGAWKNHSVKNPTFVSCGDNPAFENYLADFYGAAVGRPLGLEDTHYTRFGPPGVGPWANPVTANITQNGRDIWARALGGFSVGTSGTATATGTTSLTNSGASWTTNQWAGMRVIAGNQWANVISNTATVLTLDRWYNPATPGGAAGSTPSGTALYTIIDGAGPAWFMGLSASTTALGTPSTNTSLPSEIVTAGGGLIRQICPFAHTASANTYTLTPVFTANGSDSLPVTIGSIGVFNSMVVSDTTTTMLFNTLLGTTATLSSSGDQLTITETVTGT